MRDLFGSEWPGAEDLEPVAMWSLSPRGDDDDPDDEDFDDDFDDEDEDLDD